MRHSAVIASMLVSLCGLLACTERISLPGAASGHVDASQEPTTPSPTPSDARVGRDGADGSGSMVTVGGAASRMDASRDGRFPSLPSFPPGLPGGAQDASPDGCRDEMRWKLPYSWDRPTLLFSIDRSFSMLQRLGSSPTRMQALQQAISPLLRTYSRSIYMGYEEFPGRRNECGGGGACCAGRVASPLSPTAIESLLRCEAMSSAATGCFETSQEAPSHEAMRKCREFFESSEGRPSASTGRFVFLMTDGDPGCSERTQDPCDRLQAEVARALTENVTTLVLAIGEDAGKSACLEQAALRGGNKLLVGLTDVQIQQILQEQLSAISIRACRMTLPQAPLNSDKLVLLFDSRIVPRSETDGWAFEPGSQYHRIKVSGSWCDRLRTSQVVDIDVVQSCSACSSFGQCR